MVSFLSRLISVAICNRYALAIGAHSAFFVKGLMYLLFPIVYPLAMILDWVLGKEEPLAYRRSELKSLLSLHMAPTSDVEDEQGSFLAPDEVSIIHNVLDLSRKRAGNLCTPITSVFSLFLDDVLDEEKILEVNSK
jgi:metal transporter CNNM